MFYFILQYVRLCVLITYVTRKPIVCILYILQSITNACLGWGYGFDTVRSEIVFVIIYACAYERFNHSFSLHRKMQSPAQYIITSLTYLQLKTLHIHIIGTYSIALIFFFFFLRAHSFFALCFIILRSHRKKKKHN